MPPKKNDKDAGTYLKYNTSKWPYQPVLRQGGLTEEVLTTGDMGVLNKFLKKNVIRLTDDEITYLNLRREAQEAFIRERGKQWNIFVSKGEEKPFLTADNKNGFIGFSELKYPEPQSSDNGCWSCALSLLLRSRGVDLTQEQIRAWKPIQGKAKLDSQAAYYRNADTGVEIVDDADLITEVSPNTAVSSMSVNPLDRESLTLIGKNGETIVPTDVQKEKIISEYKKQAKEILVSKINEAILEHHSPVVLTWDGHSITVTGISEDGMLRCQDSLAEPMERYISADTVIEHSLTRHEKVTYQGVKVTRDPTGLGITWLHEAPVTSYEKDPDMKDIDFGLLNDCIKVDGSGKVIAEVPERNDVFSTIKRNGAGIISSKGITTSVTMDTTELEKELDVRSVECFGGKPFLSEANTLYPSHLRQKGNTRYAKDYLTKLNGSFEKIFQAFSTDEAPLDSDEVEKDVKGFKEKYDRLEEIVLAFSEGKVKEDKMGVDALREIPALLTHRFNDGKTLYQHINSVIPPVERVNLLKGLKEIDTYYGLDIDFGKALGKDGPVYPADMEHEANREKRFAKLKTGPEANNNDKEKWYKTKLDRIVKEEQLWQSGCAKAHVSVKGLELTEEQKKKNEAIYDSIAKNGGFEEFVKDAESIDDLFGRFMKYGITLGQYKPDDFTFKGDSIYAAGPVPKAEQQPVQSNSAESSQPVNDDNSFSLFDNGDNSQSDQEYDDDGFEKIPPELLDPNYDANIQQAAQQETVNAAGASDTSPEVQQQKEEAARQVEVYEEIDSKSLLATLEKLKKGLEEKHTVSFIGGGASNEMDKLRKSVKSVIDYIKENGDNGIRPDGLKKKMDTMKKAAAHYTEKKKNDSFRYRGNDDWKPMTGMGRTRFKAAEQIQELDYNSFVSEHSIIEAEQKVLKQLSETASAMDPKADISGLKTQLAQALASVYAKANILPHDEMPNYDAVIKGGEHSGERLGQVLDSEIGTVKQHRNFKKLISFIRTPKEIEALCKSVIGKDPTKASNSIAMEMEKAAKKAPLREKQNRTSVKRRLGLDMPGEGLIQKNSVKK